MMEFLVLKMKINTILVNFIQISSNVFSKQKIALVCFLYKFYQVAHIHICHSHDDRKQSHCAVKNGEPLFIKLMPKFDTFQTILTIGNAKRHNCRDGCKCGTEYQDDFFD